MEQIKQLLSALDRDPKSGKLLPTPQLVWAVQSACPLSAEGMALVMRCLEECSEQIYEFYRPMADVLRAQSRLCRPDEDTIRAGISLGLWEDEDWEVRAWN